MLILNQSPAHGAPLEASDAEMLGEAGAVAAADFYAAHEAYRPTPTHDMPALAAKLGLGRLSIKDEGQRLGLGSFKALGGAYAVARLAAEAAGPGGGALVLGREPLRELIVGEGLRLVDFEKPTEADVVVVSGWRDFTYMTLVAAKKALDAGAALVATSHDATMPMPGGEWPGTGAILAAVETCSGKVAEIAGKPERHLFELALSRIPDAKRVAMIGDRLSSDIAGGHAAGLDTILVLSGTTGSDGGSEDPATATVKPDLTVANLAALVG